MAYVYKMATIEDLKILTETRIEVLRAANQLNETVDMSEVKEESYNYYSQALKEGTHVAYLVFDEEEFIGAGGISCFQVMPTYHNPTGKKAYIIYMYVLNIRKSYIVISRFGISLEIIQRLSRNIVW